MMHKPTVGVYGDGPLSRTITEKIRRAGFRVATPWDTDIAWIAFETPIDEYGYGQPDVVAEQIERIRPHVAHAAVVLISSPVPVGFTARIEQAWRVDRPDLHFAYSPENVRVAHAMEDFEHQSRVVIGLGLDTPRTSLGELFEPFTDKILWMSLESAEMVKHALNSYLALSATFANEAARIGQRLGVNWPDVERALRTDPRIGEKAYVAAGGSPGRHLMREVNVLYTLASRQDIGCPLVEAICESNNGHE